MIMWKQHKPEQTIVDLLELNDNANAKSKVTLGDALDEFVTAIVNSGSTQKDQIATCARKVTKILDPKKLILSITVRDASKVFEAIKKSNKASTGYRARTVMAQAIQFAITDQLPELKTVEASSNGKSDDSDTGAMTITIGKFDDMAPLIPRYKTQGRFSATKAQVQELIFDLKDDQSATLDPEKRKMDDKEGRAIEREINKWLEKNNLHFGLRYNPLKKVFIFASKINLQSLAAPKQKKAVK